MDTLLSIAAGIGLSAACGFRVFVPLLFAAVATRYGYLDPGESMAWISSTPAIAGLAVATAVEIGAYYIPWIDNLLDSLASPLAVAAGAVAAGIAFPDAPPLVEWTAALLVGGGAAGVVQGLTVLTRAASTASTGGAGNPVVSTAELGGAVATASLAVFLPLLALCLVFALFYWTWRLFRRRKQGPSARSLG